MIMEQSFGNLNGQPGKTGQSQQSKNLFLRYSGKLQQKPDTLEYSSYISDKDYGFLSKRLSGKSVLFVLPNKESKESFFQVNGSMFEDLGALSDCVTSPMAAVSMAGKRNYDYVIGFKGIGQSPPIGMDFLQGALYLEFSSRPSIGYVTRFPSPGQPHEYRHFYSSLSVSIDAMRSASHSAKILEAQGNCTYAGFALEHARGGKVLFVSTDRELLDGMKKSYFKFFFRHGIQADYALAGPDALALVAEKKYSVISCALDFGREVPGFGNFELPHIVRDVLGHEDTAFFALAPELTQELGENSGPGLAFDNYMKLPASYPGISDGLAKSLVRRVLWKHGYYECDK